MENQRLFLVIALLFVLFLLWENWMTFQARKQPPPPVATAPVAAGQSAPQPPGAAAQDVPPGAAPAATPTPTPTALESGQRVRVTTDLFEAEIDTIGGDLRQVLLRTYSQSQQDPNPFALLQDSKANLFIIQSGLGSTDGPAPNHYARFTPEQTEYRLQPGQDSLEVRLNWSEGGVKVVKTYTFRRGSFLIDLDQRVENESGQDWRGWQYRQLQRTPPPKPPGGMFGGVYTYTGGVYSIPDKPYEKISFDQMREENLNLPTSGGWVAMIQHYFLAALVPGKGETDTFYSKAVDGERFVLGMLGQPQTIAAGAAGEFATRLYVGPKIQSALEEVAPNLRLTVDYGMLTIIAQPLFWLLKMIHGIVGNWGWAIVILTVLIRAAFFKLSETSYRSMARMRNMAPKINALKERYGDDKQRLNQAMMELYKQEKINPVSGCLPIIVQIPVFIALYWMLLESVELRQAPFMLWIHDLSEKDPYYVLPIIMGITMVIQQKLNPPPPDPTQAKIMMMLPIVFTFMFLWFPSGLVLYWVVSNGLSIIQQYVITKRMEEAAAGG